jgi:hypothetical protein
MEFVAKTVPMVIRQAITKHFLHRNIWLAFNIDKLTHRASTTEDG